MIRSPIFQSLFSFRTLEELMVESEWMLSWHSLVARMVEHLILHHRVQIARLNGIESYKLDLLVWSE